MVQLKVCEQLCTPALSKAAPRRNEICSKHKTWHLCKKQEALCNSKVFKYRGCLDSACQAVRPLRRAPQPQVSKIGRLTRAGLVRAVSNKPIGPAWLPHAQLHLSQASHVAVRFWMPEATMHAWCACCLGGHGPRTSIVTHSIHSESISKICSPRI
jgi:hypothetical protein